MFIFPEAEWGVVVLLIPVSLLLVAFPFFMARQSAISTRPFQALVVAGFVGAGLISAAFSASMLVLAFLTGAATAGLFCLVLVTGIDQGWARREALLFTTGALAATFSFFLRLNYGGWMMIPEMGTGFLVAPAIFHANLRALSLVQGGRTAPAGLMLLTDLLLLLTALLRTDMGDGNGWINVLALFSAPGDPAATPPDWLSRLPMAYWESWNVLLYVPVAIAWLIIVMILWRRPPVAEQAASG